MRKGSLIVQLVFGILGGVYTVIGGVMLAMAVRITGSLATIFTLPEEKLVLAINGTVFTALGLAFLIAAVLLIVYGKRRVRQREELLTWGTRIKGEVVDVRVNYSIRVNRRCPSVARVRCLLPSGEATLRSHLLWDDVPAVGDTAVIIYDPMDEKKYVIEFAAES